MAHQEDNNFLTPTSVGKSIEVARRHNDAAKGCWKKTAQSLDLHLGGGRKSIYYRWITWARDLHPEVVAIIGRRPEFKEAYLRENQ